ncbi:MFS transporter [Mycobacterium avium]|uniref:MFS transporter n=1 Tax=Mycobacterium avium TaxID=1764 RepID=UPI001F3E081F|nr:MFS transporter [Mycobacterium avium]
MALVMASMAALYTAVGNIAEDTSATQTQLTWIVDSYTVLLACLLLPAGAMGDRYGRREALAIGIAVFAVASLAPVFFSTPIQIIVFRAVAGAGAAFVMPATLSVLTVLYPRDQRTKAVGIWAGVAGTGAVAGIMGSALLLEVWHWQAIFVALGVIGVLISLAALGIPASRDLDAPPVDWTGAVLIGAALAAIVVGILEAPVRGWTDPLVLSALIGGAALVAPFGVVELRRDRPLLDVRLFGRRDFGASAASITVQFATNFGMFYVLMQYMQEIMGFTPLQAAMATAPMAVPILTLSVLSFWILPRLGLRAVIFAGLSLMAVGFWFMGQLGIHASYVNLAWPLVVYATGMGLSMAATTSVIMSSLPDDKQGVASAVNDAAREVGAALGIAVAGSVLAAGYGNAIANRVVNLPEPVRSAASQSLAAAMAVAPRSGGAELTEAAKLAFLHGMQSAQNVLAMILLVSAVVLGLWAPGRRQQRLPTPQRVHRGTADGLCGPPPSGQIGHLGPESQVGFTARDQCGPARDHPR